MRLNAIGQKISAANGAKEKFESRLTTVMDMPLEEGKADTVRQHLSNYEMRKIERCAHEFRYPLSWGSVKNRNAAKTEIGGNADEIRQVFQTNLDALKKSLGTEQLNEVQIKYFARVAAAMTRDANFSEILADLGGNGLKTLANGSDGLEAMLLGYKAAISVIPA